MAGDDITWRALALTKIHTTRDAAGQPSLMDLHKKENLQPVVGMLTTDLKADTATGSAAELQHDEAFAATQ